MVVGRIPPVALVERSPFNIVLMANADVVAFVEVELIAVKFWKLDWPATPVDVAVKKFARMSPATSRRESEVVAPAPIST